jgi:hypothetical protein
LLPATSFVLAQNDAATETALNKEPQELRAGPFDLHPRLSAGLSYDDNLLFSTGNKEADAEWLIQPGLRAVAGDNATLLAYRDQYHGDLDLSPGNLILQKLEDRPGKLLVLDYSPRFQVFDKYTANNSIDEFADVQALWPMGKWILGLTQQYQLQKIEVIEAGQRTTVESIPTTISAAGQLDDKLSVEGDFRRSSVGYNAPGLTGYAEYNTEGWCHYEIEENLRAGLGVLAGWDSVTNHQDQTYEQLRADARYNYTEKLAFDISGGGELRQYENGNSETLRPVFTIAAEYLLGARSWLRLAAFRQQYAAIFNGYNYTTTAATLEVRQGITDRFTASLSVSYSSVNYTSILDPSVTHTDGDSIARISLEAKIVRHLDSQVYYQFLNRQSRFNGNLDDNQAGAQLSWSF